MTEERSPNPSHSVRFALRFLPAVLVVSALAALAGSGSGSSAPNSGAAATAAARHVNAKARRGAGRQHKSTIRCVSRSYGKKRLTVCNSIGPTGKAGPTGPRGFVGQHGPRGYPGPRGSTGATGPTGTARAYALVSVKGTATEPLGVTLVAAQTFEFVSVTRGPVSGPPAEGIYCLAPGPSINPATSAAIVSGESSYSKSPSVIPYAVLVAAPEPTVCPTGQFEVKTYDLSSLGSETPKPLKPSNEAAFTIAVP